jgi:hypothetical protein
MNRQQRRAAERQARKNAGRKDNSFNQQLNLAGLNVASPEIPGDIKHDIAKVVRSIDWQLFNGEAGGICYWRAMSGWVTMRTLDIPATYALGGMIYRAGPDERADVVPFCGEGNVGRRGSRGILAHYFIVSGDNIVDFSVGDWRSTVDNVPEVEVPGLAPLRR